MLAKLCGASWNPPTLHDPFDATLARPCVARGLIPEDVQTEIHILASSFFGHPPGSKSLHYSDHVAPDFASTRACHPARRSQALSFFEDAYQTSSNQRVRNDESLQRAEGQKNVKLEDSNPEDSKIPAPEEDAEDPADAYKTQEEKLLKRIHDDEEEVVELVVAQKAAAQHEALAQQHARAAAARRAAAHAGVSQDSMAHAGHRKAHHLSHNERICRRRKTPLECQDLKAQCGWFGDEDTGRCHHKAHGEWPSGTDFLFQVGEVALLESLVIATAVVSRLRGREFLRQYAENASYNLRSSMWYFPTVLMYGLVGLYYYTRTMGWEPPQTAYFLVQIVSTVGDNDMTPIQPVPRLFTLIHILLGLVLVGGAVGEELDEILQSRVNRMSTAVARGADFQDLLPILWRVAAEARDAAGSNDQLQNIIERLESLPQHPRESRPTPNQLRWLREVRGGEVVLAELTGTGALIPWPQRSALWTGAGWRIKALLPLLRYVLENPSGPMPSYDQEATLDILEDDVIFDQHFTTLIIKSSVDIGTVILSGTLFFGMVSNWIRGKSAFTLFDGLFFSVASASSVGSSGDAFTSTAIEKAASCLLFICGSYSFNRFTMFMSEVMAFKVENSQTLLAALPRGFSQTLHRLRKGSGGQADAAFAMEVPRPPRPPAEERAPPADLPPAASSATPSRSAAAPRPGPGATPGGSAPAAAAPVVEDLQEQVDL